MRRDPLLSVTNATRAGRLRLLGITAIVIALFILDVVSGGVLRSAARSAVSLTTKEASLAGSAIISSGVFASNHALILENQDLKRRLDTYAAREASLAAAELTQDNLRSLAHLASSSTGVAAHIVSSVLASPYGTFLIGAGNDQKITVGSIVLLPDGYAVGRVAEVRSNSSVVREFFAPNSEIDVRIGGAPVHLIGRGGENAYGKAARGSQVSPGDIAIAPLLGHPVGIVGGTASSSAEAYEDVYVRLPDNLGSADLVYVVNL